MSMTLEEALQKAHQLEHDGVISTTALALIRLANEFKALVGEEFYQQIMEGSKNV